jgi:hypothetical protein
LSTSSSGRRRASALLCCRPASRVLTST